MEFSALQDPRWCRVRSSFIPCLAPASSAPRLEALGEASARNRVRSLVAEFESITGPPGASVVRYQLSSLLALPVFAMTAAGHNSITVNGRVAILHADEVPAECG